MASGLMALSTLFDYCDDPVYQLGYSSPHVKVHVAIVL